MIVAKHKEPKGIWCRDYRNQINRARSVACVIVCSVVIVARPLSAADNLQSNWPAEVFGVHGDTMQQSVGPSLGPEKFEEPPDKVDIVIEYQGPNVSDDWARLNRRLVDSNLIDVIEVDSRSRTYCDIYQQAMRLPGCSAQTISLIEELNEWDSKHLPTDANVRIPNAPLERFVYTKNFSLDETAPSNFDLRNFSNLYSKYILRKEVDDKYNRIELLLEGYSQTFSNVDESLLPTMNEIIIQELGKDVALYVTRKPSSPESAKQRYGTNDLHPTEYWESCSSATGAPSDHGASYSKLLGQLTKSCVCEGESCPVIVLIDTPVYPHPEINDAIKYDWTVSSGRLGVEGSILSTGEASPVETRRKCLRVDYSEKHHGTHLAGIMSARPRSSDSGTTHPNFQGMAPTVDFYPYQWDNGSDVRTLVKFLREIEVESGSAAKLHEKIYLFASKFRYEDFETAHDGTRVFDADGQLVDPDKRLRFPPIASSIETDSRSLWVTAAGQPDPGDPVYAINYQSLHSPLNLGDLDNVLGVTACDPCDGTSAAIWDKAYYSMEGLVHVAAPGADPIPSLATTDGYALANGTSQAAAYVAGLAAAVRSCYVEQMSQGRDLKLWLQITADPIIGVDAKKITSGVVNPTRALCDPSKHWYRGESLVLADDLPLDDPSCGRIVDDLKWCSNRLQKFDPMAVDSATNFVSTSLLRRIVRLGEETHDGQPTWVVYESGSEWDVERARYIKDSLIKKEGPIVFAPELLEQPVALVTYSDGTEEALSLDLLQDLVLRQRVTGSTDDQRCSG